jgi:uncharacterized membrane protein
METPPQQETESQSPFPGVRAGLSPMAPFRWIYRGLGDFRACPTASMFYGCCFAAMGFLLSVMFARYYQYVSALVCGFLLLGPFLAIGLYEVSRRRERGMMCALMPTLAAWRSNAGNIGVYSLILSVIFLVWARASLVTFALFYTSDMPTLEGFMRQVLSLENAEFLTVYSGVLLIFGSLVYAVSVVSIPLMLDRDQDSVTAMITSFLALVKNFPAMAVWALLIVAFTGVGVATLYIGLIFTIPLIGHATWHAYREVVEPRLG